MNKINNQLYNHIEIKREKQKILSLWDACRDEPKG